MAPAESGIQAVSGSGSVSGTMAVQMTSDSAAHESPRHMQLGATLQWSAVTSVVSPSQTSQRADKRKQPSAVEVAAQLAKEKKAALEAVMTGAPRPSEKRQGESLAKKASKKSSKKVAPSSSVEVRESTENVEESNKGKEGEENIPLSELSSAKGVRQYVRQRLRALDGDEQSTSASNTSTPKEPTKSTAKKSREGEVAPSTPEIPISKKKLLPAVREKASFETALTESAAASAGRLTRAHSRTDSPVPPKRAQVSATGIRAQAEHEAAASTVPKKLSVSAVFKIPKLHKTAPSSTTAEPSGKEVEDDAAKKKKDRETGSEGKRKSAKEKEIAEKQGVRESTFA